MKNYEKILTALLFLGNLIAVVYVWGIGDHSNVFITLGRLTGLVSFYLVLWQLLLIGRVVWLERVWGHDLLSRFHHRNGLIAWPLIALHPILIVIGYRGLSVVLQYEDVVLALIGYAMFMLIIPISLTIVRQKLRYELWYFIHFLLYGAILLIFQHQLINGQDLLSPGVRLYWMILFFGTFANVLWYRFIRPIWNSWRQGFRVERIQRETHDVVSIYLSGKLPVHPGQFILVRFLTKNLWWESHPFTVSGPMLRITPKALGDFTGKLSNLPIGTRVIVEGPLGKFTPDRAREKPVLMIAGGIGVTPMRPLFEAMPAAKFIYAARSEQDFALRDELDKIGHVDYTTSRLTPDFIKRFVPDVARRFVYLCGPPAMMKAVRKMLAGLGVPRRAILYEKFELG